MTTRDCLCLHYIHRVQAFLRKATGHSLCACSWYSIYVGLARTVYDRTFCDFPAKNTVYTPYIYGPGQPYIHLGLARTVCTCRIWPYVWLIPAKHAAHIPYIHSSGQPHVDHVQVQVHLYTITASAQGGTQSTQSKALKACTQSQALKAKRLKPSTQSQALKASTQSQALKAKRLKQALKAKRLKQALKAKHSKPSA